MQFKGLTAVVTGAASGIGRAAALRLAQEGAALFLMDKQADKLEAVAQAIRQAGGAAQAAVCDVAAEAQVEQALASALDSFGGIDILVNVAGVQVTKPVTETSYGEFNAMMGVNVGGTFLTMRKALAHMMARGRGAVVNVASELAFVGYPDLAVYTATKGAMVSMTRSAALEAIKRGVRVNCVCPGATDTPIFWEGETDPVKRRQMLEQVKLEKPIGRLITPEEVASGVVFLASDQASGVVGACLVIDGGFTAQ